MSASTKGAAAHWKKTGLTTEDPHALMPLSGTDTLQTIMTGVMELHRSLAAETASHHKIKAQLESRETEIAALHAQIAALNDKLSRKDREIEENSRWSEQESKRVNAELKSELDDKTGELIVSQRKCAQADFENSRLKAEIEARNRKVADLEKRVQEMMPVYLVGQRAPQEAIAAGITESKLEAALKQMDVAKNAREQLTQEMRIRAQALESQIVLLKNEVERRSRHNEELATIAQKADEDAKARVIADMKKDNELTLLAERNRVLESLRVGYEANLRDAIKCRQAAENQLEQERENFAARIQSERSKHLSQLAQDHAVMTNQTEKAVNELNRRSERMKLILAERDSQIATLRTTYKRDLSGFKEIADSLRRDLMAIVAAPPTPATAANAKTYVDRAVLFAQMLDGEQAQLNKGKEPQKKQ